MNNCSLTIFEKITVCVKKRVPSAVTDISFKYNYLGSDHFPMIVTIKLEMSPITTPYGNTCSKIKWEFNNDDEADSFFELVCGNLPITGIARFN